MKKVVFSVAGLAAAVLLGACSKAPAAPAASQTETTGAKSQGTEAAVQESSPAQGPGGEARLLIAAAASLEKCMADELIPLFESTHPGIKVEGTYDSSGKLQTQIEEGAEADIFVSAAMKQMNALKEEGLMEDGTVKQLLENKIVLIVSKGSDTGITKFEDILKADSIAVGDPESVPAGQYAREAYTSLGLWEDIAAKASLGTNVTEVLNWVGEGSAQAGIVYSTDAASSDKVEVVAEAPAGSVSKIIYPCGMVKSSAHPEEAKAFLEFLSSDEAVKIFEKFGFSGIQE